VTTLFLSCLLLGGGILVVQFVIGVVGAVHHDSEVHHDAVDGLDLLSVRALSAALAFFGLAGLALSGAGTTALITAQAAVVAGLAAAAGVAALRRNLRRLEPGNYADFVVLHQDIIKVPTELLLQTRVLSTWLGEKSVGERRTVQ
jgi:hypothetical protein